MSCRISFSFLNISFDRDERSPRKVTPFFTLEKLSIVNSFR